ncbi:MAG TPA: amidohydrolase family protein [Egibacteraceae bacterium]|nr:amidohydrolase family protein [Egibacteraceae bacterium]
MSRQALVVARGILDVDSGDASPRAMLIRGDRIVWVGEAPSQAPGGAGPGAETIDLGNAWVTPAFVDAHVHATATGLAAAGVDLSGCESAAECLDRLRRHAEADAQDIVMGRGWDSFGWPEGAPPSAEQISAAAPGRTVLLVRVDAHSCLVDAHTLERLALERLEGVERDASGQPTGWLREQASEAALALIRAALPEDRVAQARAAACAQAASLGIGCLHEMGHPGLSGMADALAWAAGEWPIEILVWWAELAPFIADSAALRAEGLRPGGDLFLDGSIGSRSAAVSAGYRDGAGHGELFYDDDTVAAFFTACTDAGRGAGVHAIGDRAIEQALTAMERAADELGLDAVRSSRHRIEHVELPSRDHVRRLARLGAVASLQPAFDAFWGGDRGLYADQFGRQAALESNPLSWFADEGAPLAFGSDSTVTPLDPWGAVVAAEGHLGGLGLDRRTALRAHTLGGRWAAGQDDVGPLREGMRADFAVWDGNPLAREDLRRLTCLATVVAGATAHGDLALEGTADG